MFRYAARRFVAALVLFAALTACNGNPGTKITVRIETADGQSSLPLSVAYRIEDGGWTWLRPDEKAGYSFYLPSGSERYGVAVRCGGLKTMMIPLYARASIYELTRADTTEPLFVCPTDEDPVGVEVTFDASQVTGAQSTALFDGNNQRSWSQVTTAQPEAVWVRPQNHADLLFAAYSSNWPQTDSILAARLLRDVDLAEGTALDFELSDADRLNRANVRPLPAAGGWSGGFDVGLATSAGLVAWGSLGDGGTSGGTYAQINQAAAGDLYLLYASVYHAPSPNRFHRLANVRFVEAAGAGDLEAHFPDPLPESYAPTSEGGRWRFGLDLAAGSRGLQLGTTGSETVAYFWLSEAWLRGAEAYTLPDLSPVPGFGAFDLPAEGQWSACAVYGDLSFGELLEQPHRRGEAVPAAPGRPLNVEFSCVGGSQ